MILESEFPPDVRVENEILALTEGGHEVHLACSTRKNRPENERFGKAFIHRKKISKFIYKSSVGCLKFQFYFNFWRNFVLNMCAREGFDAVHICDLPLSQIGLELKQKCNTWLIIDLHENWPALLKTATHTKTIIGRLLSSNRQWVSYEKRMLPEADKIITIVEEARDRIIQLGIDPEKISIVSNTINYDGLEISAGKKDTDAFTVFYGGAVNRHRGLQIVLEAVKKCVAKGIKIRFWIVGDGSYRKNLEELTRSLEIEPYVKFWGQKPFLEMLEILAESDVAIIPHIRNDNNDASSPNKLYQYMFLNKPIISSDCTSLKRILNETHTGFIYNNESADDLSLLIEKLSSDRSILDELNGNGKRAVIEKFNWNIDKNRLLNTYRELSPNS